MAREEIPALYQAYLGEALRLERNRKPGEGLFGIGKKPSDDPCHEKFIHDLAAALDAFAGETPSSGAVCPVLEYIYRAPLEHRDPASAYWTLIAAQGSTLPLIPLLSAADAEALRARYARDYRRWERMPVQKQVLSALERQARLASPKSI